MYLNISKLIGAATLAGACLLTFGAAVFAQTTTVTEAVEATAQITEEPGVLIVSVQDGSPAATAGLRRGDIVLAVNGAAVNSRQELQAAIVVLEPGDEVTLTVQHGDEKKEVVVVLGDRNGQPFLGIAPFGPMGPGAVFRRQAPVAPGAGVHIMPLREMRHISSTVGAHVIEVLPDSPAAVAGLQAGDRVIAVDGERLAPGDALAAVIAEHQPGDEITLEVQRGDGEGETIEVNVTLGENPNQSGKAFLGIRMAPMIFSHPARIAGPGPQGPIHDQLRFFHAPRMRRFHFHPADPYMAAPAMPPMMFAPYGYAGQDFAPFAAPQTHHFFWSAPIYPGWMPTPRHQFYVAPYADPYRMQMDPEWMNASPAVPAQPTEFDIVIDEAI